MITAEKGSCFASKDVQCGSSLHYRLSKGASQWSLPPLRYVAITQRLTLHLSLSSLQIQSFSINSVTLLILAEFSLGSVTVFVLGLAPLASPYNMWYDMWFAILSLPFTSNQRSLTSTIGYRDGLDAVWWAPLSSSPPLPDLHTRRASGASSSICLPMWGQLVLMMMIYLNTVFPSGLNNYIQIKIIGIILNN